MVMLGTPDGDPEDRMKNEEAIEAVDQCDRISDACEEVPERSEDFASSVMERVQDMRESIVRNDRVSPKMEAALDNMEAAINQSIDRGW